MTTMTKTNPEFDRMLRYFKTKRKNPRQTLHMSGSAQRLHKFLRYASDKGYKLAATTRHEVFECQD